MMRLLAALALGSLVATVASAAPARTSVVGLPAVVQRIAADGDTAAAVVSVSHRAGPGCFPIYVWSRARGSVRGIGDCWVDQVAQTIPQLAVAGGQVAWLTVTATMDVYRNVHSSTKTGWTAIDEVGAIAPLGGGGEPGGGHWSYLYGDGSLIVFDSWTECFQADADGDPSLRCRRGVPHQSDVQLMRLSADGRRATPIRSGLDAMAVSWVDGDRVVLRQLDGAVTVLRADGSLIRRFPFAPGMVLATALAGRELAILQAGSLAVYDTATGGMRRSIPLTSSPVRRLAGIGGGLAALVEGTTIRVVRLSDGRATAIVLPRRAGPVDAKLEPPGLYYSYNDRESRVPGRLALLPRAELARRF